jgi:hypothetical protein
VGRLSPPRTRLRPVPASPGPAWEPGDVATDEEVQDDLFTEWGGGDDPWRVTLRHSDVAELAKVFKLPPKVAHAPLTVDHEADRRQPHREAARDTGHTAHTMAVEDLFTDEFPDLPAFLASADRATSRRSVQFNAKQLADFAKVRPRGPLAMSFAKASGPGVGAVLVSVGERFRGAIAPMREDAGGGGTLLHATAEQD